MSSARQGLLLLLLLLGGLEVGGRRVGADDRRGDGQLVRLELLLVKLLLEMLLLLLLLDMLLLLQRVVVDHGRLVHGWLSRLALAGESTAGKGKVRGRGRGRGETDGGGGRVGSVFAVRVEEGERRVSASAGWDLLDVDWAAGEVEVWPPVDFLAAGVSAAPEHRGRAGERLEGRSASSSLVFCLSFCLSFF